MPDEMDKDLWRAYALRLTETCEMLLSWMEQCDDYATKNRRYKRAKSLCAEMRERGVEGLSR